MIDRRYILYFDWISFFLMLVLSLIGLLTVFSATYKPAEPFSIFYKKQLFGILSGILVYIVCCVIDYRTFARWGYFLYGVIIFLLIFTLIKGSVGMGGQRWINTGLFKFQPSELAKIFFAPFTTYYLMTQTNQEPTFSTFLPIIGVLCLSALLIRSQPDLGTAIILFLSGSMLLWLAGLHKKFFIISLSLTLILAPVLWHALKPYQQKRITVFLGQGDSKKERYQIEQSKIAIGSGGIAGKGYLSGTQNKLQFLPEGRTDCIFSVFCEEWGFLGAIILLLIYTLLYYRTFALIYSMKNFYTQFLTAGLIFPLMLSTLINIAMVMGLLPIVGIPLPFMTYGISHLWMSYISLGCIQSITMRRFAVTS